MAAPGRKPKPTKLHIINGNPSKKNLDTNEPKPKPIKPSCPRWLHPIAKKEWRRLAKDLERIGLLTVIDRIAFANLCQAYARMIENEKIISEQMKYMKTNSYETEKGARCLIPQVSASLRYQQLIKAFCAEFGLTPSSRSRIQLPGQEEDDEFSNFLDS